MTRIIMHGCNGAMGQTISRLVQEDATVQIVAGIDTRTGTEMGYPVFQSLRQCDIEADAIIDFSSAEAVDALLDYGIARRLPIVLCTTGLSEEQNRKVKMSSGMIPILRSANMSLGINMLMKLLQDAVKTLEPAGFDVEIVERHHNQKMDAPSGTALALADAMNAAMEGQYEYVYDRSQVRKKREKKELGISAVRGGTIVGEHEIIFAGTDEVIEFKHTAHSKAIFAKGALAAAKFIAGRRAGLYDMSDVIR